MALPWKTRIMVGMLSAVTDSSRRRDGTVNRSLSGFFNFRCPPRAGRSVFSSDHTVDASRNLWIRLFTPAAAFGASLPVILFFHGGGFAFLSPDSFAYDAVCRRLAAAIPAFVASVKYRLSPEHRFPSQYDDGLDALAFLETLLPAANLSRCFLAGGNIAHHVAVRACRARALAPGRALVAGVVAIQPFFGGSERTEAEVRLSRAPVVNVERADWMWRAFLPEGEDRDHPAANVSGPRGEEISGLREYPKTVVVVGGLDPLQDWQRRYYDWLVSSGKEAVLLDYPHAIHAFYVFPELPDSGRLILQIKDFIDSC